MKPFLLIMSTLLGATVSFSQKLTKEQYLLVGTYTGGKGEGIYVYKFNTEDGTFAELGHMKTSNPSYLAISPNQRFVYAVNENEPGTVSAYSFDKKTGKLTKLNHQSSKGNHPCYITVDKTGKWVIVGNYSSGTAAVLPVR